MIKEKQKRALINAYSYRLNHHLRDLEIRVDSNELQNLLSLLNDEDINDYFINLMKVDMHSVTDYLTKSHISVISNKKEETLRNEVKKTLNLEDITEFNKEEKGYFKFKNKNGNITVVKNLGDDSRELFTTILNNSNLANNEDGKDNASEIFTFLKNKKFIVVPFTDSHEIDTNEYPKVQVTIIREIEKQFPNKKIIASPEENIYIVKAEADEEDIILSVMNKNGHYKVVPLKQKVYKNQDEKKTEDNNQLSNNMMIELENDVDVVNEIESGLNLELSDEAISYSVEEIVNKKHPKFRGLSDLKIIIMSLISKYKKKKSNGGRQYVYSTNKPKYEEE